MTQEKLQPVFQTILTQAERNGNKVAVHATRDGGQAITYAELENETAIAGEVLAMRFGVVPGDRILLLANSHSRFISSYLAVHSIGAVCVPLDPQLPPGRFREIVERVAPRLIVADRPPPADAVPADSITVTYSELTTGRNQGLPAAPGAFDNEATADILFTTGTTGQSKGVVLSHRAIATACRHINTFIGLRTDDVEVLPLPLAHSFGLGRVRCVLSAGGTLVLTPGFVNASRVISALNHFEATGFASVPAGIAILLGDGGTALRQGRAHLRYVEIGSSAMPTPQKHLLMQALPEARLCMHYGLTEASRSAFLDFHEDEHKLDSIGRPSPGVEMRIVDDAGAEVGVDVDGYLEIRGGHLMSHYWQDDELSTATLRDGWLRSGDLGRRDRDGYFYLTSRVSDLINVGGRKVSPQEIEAILLTHPGIADCACVGLPDPQGLSGEIVCVFLVPRPGVSERPGFPELARLLRRTLEPYKMPRRFEWITAIPKSASGKVLRQQLRNAEPLQ